LRFYKLEPAEDMLVVVDDLYLPLGALRLKPKGGDGGHNGLADVARAAGGDAYARLRLGVDSKPQGASQSGYVLGRFTQEQSDALQPALKLAADAAECWVKGGIAEAMNRFNTPEEKKARGTKPKANQDPETVPDNRPGDASREAPSDQPHGPGETAPAGHQPPNASAKDR